jgi:hypothetical protein
LRRCSLTAMLAMTKMTVRVMGNDGHAVVIDSN